MTHARTISGSIYIYIYIYIYICVCVCVCVCIYVYIKRDLYTWREGGRSHTGRHRRYAYYERTLYIDIYTYRSANVYIRGADRGERVVAATLDDTDGTVSIQLYCI